jgi:ABC-type sugar transport system ATPase subunit
MSQGTSLFEIDDAAEVVTPRLELRHISKNFGGVRALRDVSVLSMSGEVHSLCGENGAGKSTLMKILAGAITDFDGDILLDGRPVQFSGPRQAEDAGIRIIYQELNLVPQLTVADNIFLGRELTRGGRLGWLDERTMEARTRQLFDRLGTAIAPRARVGDLRIGDQQMVEIAKALAFDAAIVIMDEPTSALSDSEVARLFRVIDDLRRAGTTVLYISHKMNEVFTLSDRVTVLRDGQFVASAQRDATRTTSRTRSSHGPSSKSRTSRCPTPPGAAGPACATSRSRCGPARSWASPAYWAPGVPNCSRRSTAPACRRRRAPCSSKAGRSASDTPTRRSAPASPWSPRTARPSASSIA